MLSAAYYPLAYSELILNGDPEQYLKAVTVKSFFD
ncbi:DUF6061 family protein [Phascolarctobacterium succinatutens]